MKKKPALFSFHSQDLERPTERLQENRLLESDWELLGGVVTFVTSVQHSVEEMRISLQRLQNLPFGKKTEKTNPSTFKSPPEDPDYPPDPPGSSTLRPDVSSNSAEPVPIETRRKSSLEDWQTTRWQARVCAPGFITGRTALPG